MYLFSLFDCISLLLIISSLSVEVVSRVVSSLNSIIRCPLCSLRAYIYAYMLLCVSVSISVSLSLFLSPSLYLSIAFSSFAFLLYPNPVCLSCLFLGFRFFVVVGGEVLRFCPTFCPSQHRSFWLTYLSTHTTHMSAFISLVLFFFISFILFLCFPFFFKMDLTPADLLSFVVLLVKALYMSVMDLVALMFPKYDDINGEIALVTGGGSGIGRYSLFNCRRCESPIRCILIVLVSHLSSVYFVRFPTSASSAIVYFMSLFVRLHFE